jgi:hypothetical protein
VARREAYERLASAVHSASFRASALRIPLLPGSSFTGVDVDKAFEVVVAATGAVHIRGSNAARDQADVLFEACQTFVNVTNATPAGPTTPELQTTFDAMVKARKDFLGLLV